MKYHFLLRYDPRYSYFSDSPATFTSFIEYYNFKTFKTTNLRDNID